MSLATVDDFQTYLGLNLSPAQQDRAQLLLDLASGAIQRHTRQTIELVENDEAQLLGNWTPSLVLPQVPVQSVSAVSTEIDGTLTEDVDWTFDGQRTLWRGPNLTTTQDWDRCGRHWGGERARVTVTYTHGWEDIPNEIRGVCLQSVTRVWRNPAGVTSEGIGQYQVSYGPTGISLTRDEKTLLNALRRKWMGS